MRGRPNLYTDYSKESAIFSNNTQKVWFVIVVISAIVFSFFASDYWLLLLTTAFLIAVASWGLNIVSGFAGQINLAHGFFVGIGTYTSAIIGGIATSSVIGYELDMIIWLPLSGITASIVGLMIAPITVRLKGLNLGLVTLALVFIGSHLFSNFKTVLIRLFFLNKSFELSIYYLQYILLMINPHSGDIGGSGDDGSSFLPSD